MRIEPDRVRARYDDFNNFRRGLLALKHAHIHSYHAFGPTNLVDVDELMPVRFSPVRGFAIFAGFIGLVMFWVMCITTSDIYSLVVGGKPPISNVPFVIPAYEGTILSAAVIGFAVALVIAAIGFHQPPADYDPHFSEDSYGVEVLCRLEERTHIMDLLRNTGAVEVHEV